MYIVVIAWSYVALMMAVAEALHPQGGLLGALITFVLYGAAPMALVVYLMRAPQRRRKARADALAEAATSDLAPQADGGGHAARAPIAPEGKEV